MNKPIKTVLFDCDGTILDSYKVHKKINRQISKEFGFKKPLIFAGQPASVVLKNLGFSVFKIKNFLKRFGELELEAKLKIFPAVNALLESLKERKILTAIVTNRPTTKEYFQLLESANLKSELLDFYVNCDIFPHRLKTPKNHFSGKYPKPDARIISPINKNLKKLDIFPESILMVGDHLVDFQLAKFCGFQFIGVLSGVTKTLSDWYSQCQSYQRVLPTVDSLLRFFD